MNINPNNPINKIAANVVAKSLDKGTNYHPGNHLTSALPLPIIQYTGLRKDDLIGKRKGRFVVIGLSASFIGSSGKGLRWVVKCDCGRYEIRTTTTIKKGSHIDSCLDCKKTASLRRKENWLCQKNLLINYICLTNYENDVNN